MTVEVLSTLGQAISVAHVVFAQPAAQGKTVLVERVGVSLVPGISKIVNDGVFQTLLVFRPPQEAIKVMGAL